MLTFRAAVQVLVLDLTEGGAMKRLNVVGAVDILVNNAGAISSGDLQMVDAGTRWLARDLKAFLENFIR